MLKLASMFVVLLSFIFLLPVNVQATSQWARQYNTSCFTCHTAFPRLTYYGERFMRNGYQDPDNTVADGNTKGKTEMNDNLVLSTVSNWFGVRLSATPVKWDAKARKEEGKLKDKLILGESDWFQFFVGGSIFKNLSIFIEAEFNNDASYKTAWFKMGYHNIFDTSLANITFGNISPRDYGSYSNRLRLLPPLKADIFEVKGSGTGDENAYDLSSQRPGIQFYGYKGPVLYWLGSASGSNSTKGIKAADENGMFDYWGGLRLECPKSVSSSFEGSSLSAWAYQGSRSKDISKTTPVKDEFTRYSIETQLRYGNGELQAAYVTGQNDNGKLESTKKEFNFDGYSIVGGYSFTIAGNDFHYGAQYDVISPEDESITKNKSYLKTGITYFPMENWRVSLYGSYDVERDSDHQVFMNIRTMF